jgi:hypothetical protein
MLAHSPPFPLSVDYINEDGITEKDEAGILLALEQRHRIRHLRLVLPVQNLRNPVMTIDGEFPILEYLILEPPRKESAALKLPETLQAPNLHHLTLDSFACPLRSRLHPTAAGLVTLCLVITHPSAYFQPKILLQWISFMSQLESLAVLFTFAVPNRDVERQLTHTPITTHITLPNLRVFAFRGASAYLGGVVRRITTPPLQSIHIRFFKQLTYSIPRLPQFMDPTESLRFDNIRIQFRDKSIEVFMFLRGADRHRDPFRLTINCWHLDWQVSSAAQICNALTQVFSAVEHLTLENFVHSRSSEEHNDVDRNEWRKLLWSFSNVKNLRVKDSLRLVENLSRCLRPEDGELPLEVLPELQNLTYSGTQDAGDGFTSFIDARKDAGRPVTLVREA